MQRISCIKRVDWLLTALFVLYGLVLLGLAISGWNWYDVQWFLKWTKHDILHVYESPKCAYFPLTPLLFVALYRSAQWIAESLHLSNSIYLVRLLVKLPLIISAIVIAVILYRYGGEIPLVAWIISAAVYSNIWSLQFDLIVGLLVLLSCLALTRRNVETAGLLLGLAVLFKQAVAVCIIPHILAIKLSGGKLRDVVRYLTAFLLVVTVVLTPFILADYKSFIEKAILFHAKRMPQDLSIWNLPQVLSDFKVKIPELSWVWEVPFIMSVIILILILVSKRVKCRVLDLDLVLALTSIFLLALLLWNKVGNPGYVLWVLPLLLLLFREKLSYAVLTVFSTLVANFVYPWMLCVPAAVLGKEVFIVEDWKYWPARLLLENSTVGLPLPLRLYLILPLLPGEKKIMLLLEKCFPIVAVACIIVYNVFIIVSMVLTWRRINRNLY